ATPRLVDVGSDFRQRRPTGQEAARERRGPAQIPVGRGSAANQYLISESEGFEARALEQRLHGLLDRGLTAMAAHQLLNGHECRTVCDRYTRIGLEPVERPPQRYAIHVEARRLVEDVRPIQPLYDAGGHE